MFNQTNIARAKEDFAKKRYCVIDNILKEDYIQALYEAVLAFPYQLRSRATGLDVQTYPVDYNTTEEFKVTLDEYIRNAKGNFSYFHHVFVAAKSKKEHANEYVTRFNHNVTEDYSLYTPEYTFHDLATEVTGFPNMQAKHGNYGFYDYQSWLKMHNDVRRWCAYIFYFNPSWQPDWGGQLCIMDDDVKEIRESIIPYGNRLVLMDVSKVDINTHFVSPVSIGADHPRYSLSGWFYQRDKDGPGPEKRLTNP
jgi:Rps23 Pro-64 3,4-dihydroxylase Tpa1-like proline 4-hydroxylase